MPLQEFISVHYFHFQRQQKSKKKASKEEKDLESDQKDLESGQKDFESGQKDLESSQKSLMESSDEEEDDMLTIKRKDHEIQDDDGKIIYYLFRLTYKRRCLLFIVLKI